MEVTNEYQANYIARVLSKQDNQAIEKLSSILLDSRVDLNPHQVQAALFAISNPFSKGVILADEVGLGKTIEAGIIIAQKWAEGKQNIIIVVPAMLKVQWLHELKEKFYLPVSILGNKINVEFNDSEIADNENELINEKTIKICSYNYAYNHKNELQQTVWDMAIFDEAHKLRNFHTKNNLIANTLDIIFKNVFKVLVTATPIHNSLLDIFSLVSFIDEYVFGDIETFKDKFITNDNAKELSQRLKYICTRTLRRQVLEYIKYTDRYLITQNFEESENEKKLYKELCSYIYEKSKLLNKLPKYLIGILLLKALSSSPEALKSMILKIKNKIKNSIEQNEKNISINIDDIENEENETYMFLLDIDIEEELNMIDYLINLCEKIDEPTKSKELLKALDISFKNLKQKGANEKAVIFTERIKTQEYLYEYLLKNGYKKDEVIFLNGSSKNRADIIYNFENKGKILICTEVGGEGVNLQFCSCVINYDLPFNPQRIEQRIGRCHRYGQKFDVAVVNFLDKDNYIDNRIYDLLTNKFHLFEGVFGASDTVLSVMEDMDFENKLNDIFFKSRGKAQIDKAFYELQNEMQDKIKAERNNAKKQIFEYLDSDVANKFKDLEEQMNIILDKKEKLLWDFTKYKLKLYGQMTDNPPTIILNNQKYKNKRFKAMIYRMDKNEPAVSRYRLNCSLSKEIIFDSIYNDANESAIITYKLDEQVGKSFVLENLKDKKGVLGLFEIKKEDEYLYSDFVLLGYIEEGEILNHQTCEKILLMKENKIERSFCEIDGEYINNHELVDQIKKDKLVNLFNVNVIGSYTNKARFNINKYYEKSMQQMESWANDKIDKIEKGVKVFEKKIKNLRKESRIERDFKNKIKILNKIKELEKEHADKLMEMYEKQEEIRQEKNKLIEELEINLDGVYIGKLAFVIEFSII